MKRINFIPEEFARSRDRRRLAIRVVVPLVVAAAATGWWLGHSRPALRALDDQIEVLTREIETARTEVVQVSDAAQPVEKVSDRLVLVQALRARVPATWVIAAITESMPSAMGFSSLSVSAAPIRPASIAADDPYAGLEADDDDPLDPMILHLEGLAPDDLTIARFIGRLDARPLFENVELAYSRPLEGADLLGREFRITVEIPLDQTYVLDTGDGGRADHAQ